MATLDQRDAISNMVKKGYIEVHGGSHRAFNYTTIDGKRTAITTHVSRSPQHKVITETLISRMAAQCKLSRKDFIRFAKCEMSQHEYEYLLTQAGEI